MRVLPFHGAEEIASAVPVAAAHLRQDGLLGHPTETVYGLGSRPAEDPLAALSKLKSRDPDKPFLLLVSGREMAEAWGLRFNRRAAALAEAFWPGPLTLILPATGDRLPRAVRGLGGEGGVAVRWTSGSGLAQLLDAVQCPITSTSANRSGEAPATDVETIRRVFGPVPGLLVLDGGRLSNAVPSTILDCTTEAPRIVREGAIRQSELAPFQGGAAR
jgi:L-threonylcarbamoyladenylate synthase